eukprot:5689004-Pleurochrysis_carterae.AAC.1
MVVTSQRVLADCLPLGAGERVKFNSQLLAQPPHARCGVGSAKHSYALVKLLSNSASINRRLLSNSASINRSFYQILLLVRGARESASIKFCGFEQAAPEESSFQNEKQK